MSEESPPTTKPIPLGLLIGLAVFIVALVLLDPPGVGFIVLSCFLIIIAIVVKAYWDRNRPAWAYLLISTVLSFSGFGIIGIGLGIVSLWKMRGSRGNMRDKLLTTLGLVVSLFISFIIYMALSAALMSAREASERMTCRDNMKHLYNAMIRYAYENDDHLPPRDQWQEALTPFVHDAKHAFACPCEEDGKASYMYLGDGFMKLSDLSSTKTLPILLETRDFRHRHYDGRIVCIADGSITVLVGEKLEKALSDFHQWADSQRRAE